MTSAARPILLNFKTGIENLVQLGSANDDPAVASPTQAASKGFVSIVMLSRKQNAVIGGGRFDAAQPFCSNARCRRS